MGSQGLFIGLITGDVIYQVAQMPAANGKVVALDYCFAAGGPATNAAIAYQQLGGQSQLMGALGQGTLGQLLHHELATLGLNLFDVSSDPCQDPPLSSIMITAATGDRAVVSRNAVGLAAVIPQQPELYLDGISVLLIDGHQLPLGKAIAPLAQTRRIPVVIDAGSWKPNFEQILCHSDYIICSADFAPPHCHTQQEIVAYLKSFQPRAIAITHGANPILWWTRNANGEIPIPPIDVVDTLGAGDILHGAFCYYISRVPFTDSLKLAAQVASKACQFFGTRAWLSRD